MTKEIAMPRFKTVKMNIELTPDSIRSAHVLSRYTIDVYNWALEIRLKELSTSKMMSLDQLFEQLKVFIKQHSEYDRFPDTIYLKTLKSLDGNIKSYLSHFKNLNNKLKAKPPKPLDYISFRAIRFDANVVKYQDDHLIELCPSIKPLEPTRIPHSAAYKLTSGITLEKVNDAFMIDVLLLY
jgi:hypothetical protein